MIKKVLKINGQPRTLIVREGIPLPRYSVNR